MNIANLSAEQLRRAAEIKDQIEKLNGELSNILGSSTPSAGSPKQRGPRRMSAAAKAKLSAMAKARWAKARKQGKTTLKGT